LKLTPDSFLIESLKDLSYPSSCCSVVGAGLGGAGFCSACYVCGGASKFGGKN
jgi:hypothetical protein